MTANVTNPAFSATVREKRCLSPVLTRAGLSLVTTVVLLLSSAPLFSHAQQYERRVAKSGRSSPAPHQELQGRTLRLQFRVFTNPVLPTTFRIDDVSLLWTQ